MWLHYDTNTCESKFGLKMDIHIEVKKSKIRFRSAICALFGAAKHYFILSFNHVFPSDIMILHEPWYAKTFLFHFNRIESNGLSRPHAMIVGIINVIVSFPAVCYVLSLMLYLSAMHCTISQMSINTYQVRGGRLVCTWNYKITLHGLEIKRVLVIY